MVSIYAAKAPEYSEALASALRWRRVEEEEEEEGEK